MKYFAVFLVLALASSAAYAEDEVQQQLDQIAELLANITEARIDELIATPPFNQIPQANDLGGKAHDFIETNLKELLNSGYEGFLNNVHDATATLLIKGILSNNLQIIIDTLETYESQLTNES